MASGIAFAVVMVVSWQMPYVRDLYRSGIPGESLASQSGTAQSGAD